MYDNEACNFLKDKEKAKKTANSPAEIKVSVPPFYPASFGYMRSLENEISAIVFAKKYTQNKHNHTRMPETY